MELLIDYAAAFYDFIIIILIRLDDKYLTENLKKVNKKKSYSKAQPAAVAQTLTLALIQSTSLLDPDQCCSEPRVKSLLRLAEVRHSAELLHLQQ